MSHLLDRLNFLQKKTLETFSDDCKKLLPTSKKTRYVSLNLKL